MAAIVRDDDQLAASDSDDDDYVPDLQSPAKRSAPLKGSKKRSTGLVLDQDSDEEDVGKEGEGGEASDDGDDDDVEDEDDGGASGDNDDKEGEEDEGMGEVNDSEEGVKLKEEPSNRSDGGDNQQDNNEDVEKGHKTYATRVAKRPRIEVLSAGKAGPAHHGEADQRSGNTFERAPSIGAGLQTGESTAGNIELEQKHANGSDGDKTGDRANGRVGSGEEAPRVKETKADVDDIWASMNRAAAPRRTRAKTADIVGKTDPALAAWLGTGATSSVKRSDNFDRSDRSKTNAQQDKALAGWLGIGAPKSGLKTVRQEGSAPDVAAKAASGGLIGKVVRLEDAMANCEHSEDGKKPKVTGLENVLSAIKGDKGPRVIDKTRDAWSNFKKDDVDVADELDAYKKDKNRYTDKVAFLDRTELREWQADMERKRRR